MKEGFKLIILCVCAGCAVRYMRACLHAFISMLCESTNVCACVCVSVCVSVCVCVCLCQLSFSSLKVISLENKSFPYNAITLFHLSGN